MHGEIAVAVARLSLMSFDNAKTGAPMDETGMLQAATRNRCIPRVLAAHPRTFRYYLLTAKLSAPGRMPAPLRDSRGKSSWLLVYSWI